MTPPEFNACNLWICYLIFPPTITSVAHTYVPQNFHLYHQGQLLKSEKIAERMSETVGITMERVNELFS